MDFDDIVRATHFMPTTPLSLWSKQAEQFDRKICHTVFQCLGLKPVNEAYEVSVSTGESWIMFTASWFEAQVTTHESWVKPDDADC